MDYLTYIVAGLGAIALIGTFARMKSGYGPNNIKALGIVIVSVFVAILATKEPCALTAAIGLFGSIAGYIFGTPKE